MIARTLGPRFWTLGLVLFAALVGCRSNDEGAGELPESSPKELVEWMSGSFSSAGQAMAEPDEFLDIRLYMTPIWTEREDGPWLYVEQAVAGALERPYRQRVYHLVASGGGVRSDVYELPGAPMVYAGAWSDPARFAPLRPSLLIERTGCSIHLHRTNHAYVGATRGEGCPSVLNDAMYATSIVTITDTGFSSWDRGFDLDGKQVWGATAGSYEFAKDLAE